MLTINYKSLVISDLAKRDNLARFARLGRDHKGTVGSLIR